MKTIQIFDPALCCSSGVCGPETDPALVAFAADFEWARTQASILSVSIWHSNHCSSHRTKSLKAFWPVPAKRRYR